MRKTRRQLLGVGARAVVGAALLPIAAACTPAQSVGSPVPTTGPAGTQPKKGGELRILYHSLARPDLDPVRTSQNNWPFQSLISEGLTEIGPDLKPAPALAESWSIADDGLMYTFKLRKGVKFHNGREMVADDVVYTYDRLRDPATNYPRRQQWTAVSKVTAPDAGTVSISLARPFAPLLAILAGTPVAIVPKEEVAKGTFSSRPVGTGPFKFVEFVVDDRVTLEANPTYWRTGVPYLERITFVMRSDENAKVLEFRSGRADFISDAPGASYDSFANDPNFVVYGGRTAASQGTYAFMMLNETKQAAFKDVRVRQAIYTVLDRDTMAGLALPGLSEPLNGGPLSANHWAGLQQPVYKKDVAKAKELLAAAGYANGLKFKMDVTGLSQHTVRAAQVIKEQLREVGVDVEIAIFPASAGSIVPLINSLQWEAVLDADAGQPDPDLQLQMFILGQNALKWSDAQVTELVLKAQRTPNQADRVPLYRDAQKRLAEVGPFGFLYLYNKYSVAAKFVKGYVYSPNFFQLERFRAVWLDK